MAKSNALKKASKGSTYSLPAKDFVIYGVDVEVIEDTDQHLVEDDKGRLKVDPAMAKNIAHRGVTVPIICRIIGDDVVVVDGRRRIINARKADEIRAERGEEPLPVRFLLERGAANVGAKLTAISANSFRKDHGVMAQARKASDLLNAGVDENEVAVTFGFSKSTLSNRLKLVELPKAVQRFVEAGSLSFMSALELHGLEPDEAVAAAEELVEEGAGKGQASRARKKGKGKDSEKVERPSLGLLKKMLKTEAISDCSEDVIKMLRWVTGDLTTPNTIEGLAAAVKEATAAKKPPTNKAE